MKEFLEVKDSGARTEFETGAVRDMRESKGRFDLIPYRPMQRLATHFQNGAVKYGESNYRKGIPLRTYLDSALRHIFKLLDGWDDEDHSSAALWNLVCFINTQEEIEAGLLPDSLDDLDYRKNWDAPEVSPKSISPILKDYSSQGKY